MSTNQVSIPFQSSPSHPENGAIRSCVLTYENALIQKTSYPQLTSNDINEEQLSDLHAQAIKKKTKTEEAKKAAEDMGNFFTMAESTTQLKPPPALISSVKPKATTKPTTADRNTPIVDKEQVATNEGKPNGTIDTPSSKADMAKITPDGPQKGNQVGTANLIGNQELSPAKPGDMPMAQSTLTFSQLMDTSASLKRKAKTIKWGAGQLSSPTGSPNKKKNRQGSPKQDNHGFPDTLMDESDSTTFSHSPRDNGVPGEVKAYDANEDSLPEEELGNLIFPKKTAISNETTGLQQGPELSASTPSEKTKTTNNATSKSRVRFADTCADHRRVNCRYLVLQLEVGKSTGPRASGVSSARLAFVKAIKCIKRDVDDRFILYTYDQSNENETDACAGLDTFPTTFTQICKFADGFRCQANGGRLLVRIRVGFDAEEKDFLYAARAALISQQAAVYLKTLQEPHTVAVGWLLFSDKDMHIEYWVSKFEESFKKLADKKHPPTSATGNQIKEMRIGLAFKFIWDGTDRPAGHKGTKALHAEFTKDQALLGYSLLREVLATEISHLCNIPMRLIPLFKKTDSIGLKEKIRKAIELQYKATGSLMSMTNFGIINIDRKITHLQVSLRTLIMQMTTETGDKLFFRINPNYANSGGYRFTFPTAYKAQARKKLSCLGAWLQKKHGDAVFTRFTKDAV